jgi:Rrf2 family transcriptional regulator, nitric oxide-sensitive transcriptional repressor
MQLTQFTDYSLRLCLYLSAHPDRRVPVEEVSRAYGISRNHLVKVVQKLVDRGYVDSLRGRGGGMVLAMQPAAINIGQLVRDMEPTFFLAECFDLRHNSCPIVGLCGFHDALAEAKIAFLSKLDGYHLADFQKPMQQLQTVWQLELSRPIIPDTEIDLPAVP